ncbi:MAG: hypothetical protein H6732_07605 [Alphaproteobacteria bacterium]|nr:hypothetical protein [Alphaproteobacteria bacterium]
MKRTAAWWWVPGVAGIVCLLQLVRNSVPPFANLTLSFDGDAALHLVLGDLMLQQGGWLDTEPTSVLAGDTPFIAHEWLAEVAMALAARPFGLAGPVILAALVVALLAAGMHRRALAMGATTWPAVVVLVAALMVQNTHLHPRPHVLTWALGFAFVTGCEQLRTGALAPRAWLGRSLLIVLLWAQVHAGFLVIAPVLLAFGVGSVLEALAVPEPGAAWRRAGTYAGGLVVLLLASGLNPWGFALHAHFLAWLGNDYMTSFTTEFQSPDFRGPAGWILLAYMTLLWVGLAGARTPPPAPWLLLSLGLNAMALHSARHGALFATFTAPFVAERLSSALGGLARSPGPLGDAAGAVLRSSHGLDEAEARRGGWGLVALALVGLLGAVGLARTPEITFDRDLQPVDAVDWIEAHPDALEGPMFNSFRWGAYLAWRLYPDRQVFLNSWHDHLGEEALRTYFEVHDVTPGWEKVLRRHRIAWVIYPTGSHLAHALDDDDSWERVYQDATAGIWVRRRVGS